MTRADRSASRRAELLAVGVRLFSTRAYDAVSTDDLRRECGVSAGLLYHYFGDKRGFYLVALEACAAELLGAIEFDPAEAATAIDRFLDHAQARPELFRGVLRGGGGDAEAYAIVRRTRTELARRVLAALGRPLGGSAAERLAVTAWVGGVEAATLHWLDTGEVARADVSALALSTLPTLAAE